VTPTSSPRFSNTNTCSTSGIAFSSRVRSTQASITVSTRCGESEENAAEWSLVQHTTSDRPTPGRRANSGSPAASSSGSGPSAASPVSAGNRFSNTTTS
jgi:hypothetical protein